VAGYVAMAVFSVAVFAGIDVATSAGSAPAPTALSPLPTMLRYAAVLLFSALGGLVPSTLFSLAARVAPDEGTVSSTVGWMQQGSALGLFVVPPLLAWVASQAGGWQWSWLVTVGAALLGLLLAYALARTPVRPVLA
jgi:MFS transporter, CP family, cyanate transporter